MKRPYGGVRLDDRTVKGSRTVVWGGGRTMERKECTV